MTPAILKCVLKNKELVEAFNWEPE